MGMKDLSTKEGMDLELSSGQDMFLLFYSPWCPFCVEFLPAFDKLAAGSPGTFCKVSTDGVPEAEDSFNIDVVPTVLFFRGGKPFKRLDGKQGIGLAPENLAEFVWKCRSIAKI